MRYDFDDETRVVKKLWPLELYAPKEREGYPHLCPRHPAPYIFWQPGEEVVLNYGPKHPVAQAKARGRKRKAQVQA